MAFTPRQATLHDVGAVESVVRRAYTPYISRIGREPGPMLDDYAALIGDGRVHLIERGGAVQAILVLIPKPDGMLLDNVAVVPEAHGQGLGRAMLLFAEHSARAGGHRWLKLYTHEAMTENIALYSRLGYVETHRAEERGFKRVYMAKAL